MHERNAIQTHTEEARKQQAMDRIIGYFPMLCASELEALADRLGQKVSWRAALRANLPHVASSVGHSERPAMTEAELRIDMVGH